MSGWQIGHPCPLCGAHADTVHECDPTAVLVAVRAEAINNARRVARKALDYYYQNFEKDGGFDEGTSWQDMVRETIADCRSMVLVAIDKLNLPPTETQPEQSAATYEVVADPATGGAKLVPRGGWPKANID